MYSLIDKSEHEQYNKNKKGMMNMAMIKCAECGKDISDKAMSCIHCGYPISSLVYSENIVNGELVATETPNIVDDKTPSKQPSKTTTEVKKQNMGCGIAIAVIVVIILIVSLFGGEDHDDGKCDICGDSGAIQVSSDAELCMEHVLWANDQYYKDNDNYGGF